MSEALSIEIRLVGAAGMIMIGTREARGLWRDGTGRPPRSEKNNTFLELSFWYGENPN